jgi:hypothetical protein
VERREIDQADIEILDLDPHPLDLVNAVRQPVDQLLQLAFEPKRLLAMAVLPHLRRDALEGLLCGVKSAFTLGELFQHRSNNREERVRFA